MSYSTRLAAPDGTLYLGDCREVFPTLSGGSVDLVVMDPPYNIASPHALTRAGGRIVSTADAWGVWDRYAPQRFRELFLDVFRGLARILRPGGQVYCWIGAQGIGLVLEAAESAGLRYRAKLVAVKARPQPSWRESNWRSAYEECLYFAKGQAQPFHFRGQEAMRNVLALPYEPKASAHPTEKRPAMLAPLIRASSDPGQVVLDPFLGSGTTAVVARSLGRRYIGIERSPRYFAMARRRLAAEEDERGRA